MKAIIEPTCVKAWLKAVTHLAERPHQRDYNLILEIAAPMQLPAEDKQVYELVDAKYREKDGMPLSTVINTIFPASLFVNHGKSGVFDHYNSIWPKLSVHPESRKWGTYARRMTRRQKSDGLPLNPLEILLDKLTKQVKTAGPKQAAYELGTLEPMLDIPIYDPSTDCKPIMGGPCLSHVSFKLKDDGRLMLTAFYRSHYYIARALGNLFGLAWLQHFLAKEAGIECGELVCISSMAQLDKPTGWKSGDVNGLLNTCLEAQHTSVGEL